MIVDVGNQDAKQNASSEFLLVFVGLGAIAPQSIHHLQVCENPRMTKLLSSKTATEKGSAPVSGAVFGVLAEYIFPFRPGATIGEFTRYSQIALAFWTAAAATPLFVRRLDPGTDQWVPPIPGRRFSKMAAVFFKPLWPGTSASLRTRRAGWRGATREHIRKKSVIEEQQRQPACPPQDRPEFFQNRPKK
jgi:hypothetical protein